MKSYVKETQDLLKSATNVPVFSDVAPEGKYPVITWNNIGFQEARILHGRKTPAKIFQRVIVVVSQLSSGDFDTILADLSTIDNTNNADFQRVEIALNFVEPTNPESPVCRMMLDLNLTAR